MPFELRSWIGLAALVGIGASVAWAQPAPVEAVQQATSPVPTRHRCRLFATELEATVDTWDRSTPLGQWVLDQQNQGWQVDDIELTVGRKSTGFVQAYAQVCMVPRS